MTSMASLWCLYHQRWTYLAAFSSVSVVNFDFEKGSFYITLSETIAGKCSLKNKRESFREIRKLVTSLKQDPNTGI